MIPGVVDSAGGKVLDSFSDNFNRANSTDIATSTIKWSELTGDWQISNNALTTATAAANYPMAIVKTNTKNATVSVSNSGGGDGWGVAVWVVDTSNWFAVQTDFTRSFADYPATVGTINVYCGNSCAAGTYNGCGVGCAPCGSGSLWGPGGGTCYELAGYYEYTCPGGSSFVNGYCGNTGGQTGGCLDNNYNYYLTLSYPGGSCYPTESCCVGGQSCCYSPSSQFIVTGYAWRCPAQPPENYCPSNSYLPQPQYQQQQVNYPAYRIWTYSHKAIIKKMVAGVLSTVLDGPVSSSTEQVAEGGAAGNPAKTTTLTVTTNNETITVSGTGSSGGNINATTTVAGANRGKKQGVLIAPASVNQANAVDNFVYTKPV